MTSSIKHLFDDRTKFSYVVIFLVLGFFSYLLIIKNDLGTFFALNQTASEISANISTLDEAAKGIDYINDFNLNFTQIESTSRLMEVVTDIASDEEIKFNIVKPVSSRSVAEYKIMRIEAEGFTDYAKIIRLVEKIEKHKACLLIEDLTIGPMERTGSSLRQEERPATADSSMSNEPKQRIIKFSIIIASVGHRP